MKFYRFTMPWTLGVKLGLAGIVDGLVRIFTCGFFTTTLYLDIFSKYIKKAHKL